MQIASRMAGKWREFQAESVEAHRVMARYHGEMFMLISTEYSLKGCSLPTVQMVSTLYFCPFVRKIQERRVFLRH